MVGTAHGNEKPVQCKCTCACKELISLNLYDGYCSFCKYGVCIDEEGKDII